MGDVIDFKGRRENFMKGIQLNDGKVSYIGNRMRTVIGTPEQAANRRRLEEEVNHYYSLSPEERLEIQRRKMQEENARRKKKRKIKRATTREQRYTGKRSNLQKALFGLALTGVVLSAAVGGIKVNEINKNYQAQMNLEAISQDPNMLQDLGISKNTINEIQSLQAELDSEGIEGISNEDMLDLGDRVEDIQMYTLKSKLANSLGVPIESIELSIDYNEEIPVGLVKVTNNDEVKIYNSNGILDFDNNIPTEISNYIVNIGKTQTANSRLAEGTMDKSSALTQYSSAIDDATKITSKEVSVDDKGNITLTQVSQQEIDALIQNDGKTQENDEER